MLFLKCHALCCVLISVNVTVSYVEYIVVGSKRLFCCAKAAEHAAQLQLHIFCKISFVIYLVYSNMIWSMFVAKLIVCALHTCLTATFKLCAVLCKVSTFVLQVSQFYHSRIVFSNAAFVFN
jgi:hypothetical protein